MTLNQSPSCLSPVSSVLRVHSIINLIYLLKNYHSHCLLESLMISYLKLHVAMGQPLTWTELFANLWLVLIPREIRSLQREEQWLKCIFDL